MNSDEYANLAEIEERYWFYSGKRSIVRFWLDRVSPLKETHLLVDVGAGTGLFVEEMSARCKAIAMDDHMESLLRPGGNHRHYGSGNDRPLE